MKENFKSRFLFFPFEGDCVTLYIFLLLFSTLRLFVFPSLIDKKNLEKKKTKKTDAFLKINWNLLLPFLCWKEKRKEFELIFVMCALLYCILPYCFPCHPY